MDSARFLRIETRARIVSALSQIFPQFRVNNSRYYIISEGIIAAVRRSFRDAQCRSPSCLYLADFVNFAYAPYLQETSERERSTTGHVVSSDGTRIVLK